MSAPGLKITNFHYAHIVLPVSQPTEYPKWIHMSGYESVIAQDAQEEARLLERPSKSGEVVVALEGAAAQADHRDRRHRLLAPSCGREVQADDRRRSP